jgi:hypothetical protein
MMSIDLHAVTLKRLHGGTACGETGRNEGQGASDGPYTWNAEATSCETGWPCLFSKVEEQCADCSTATITPPQTETPTTINNTTNATATLPAGFSLPSHHHHRLQY